MSEFECSCGNFIKPSVGHCEKCGGRPVRMDGYTSRELDAIEKIMEERDAENENENSCM